MLSRVAENIYWMARYIERAENTARLVNVTNNLILDLPSSANVGWEHITRILGNEKVFHENYSEADERSILKYMISDVNNASSIVSSLQQARENARTIRDIIPRETWEQVNDLYLVAKTNAQSGIARKNRYNYLQKVIAGAQTITGQLAGTMYHDMGYEFLRMGRNLERADMTSRIIDVRSADLLSDQRENLTPYENIQWMSVLKSLTGYQMYRRVIQVRVQRPDVLKFLLQEKRFPRAFFHTICEVEGCLGNLPRHDEGVKLVAALKHSVQSVELETLKQQQLHEYIDELQLGLVNLHKFIADTYFLHHT